MSCESVRECLQEHLDGIRHPLELAARLPDWAQRHLESCPACREASWQLVSLECSLRRMNEVPPMPIDLTSSVIKALQAEPVAPPVRDRRWTEAAVVLILGLSAYGLTWLDLPVAFSAFASLIPTWSLPSLSVPGLTETMTAVLAGLALFSATALNWRWGAAR